MSTKNKYTEMAVLISIQPKWCELIASGKKTIEIRKTRPKIDTPFKCYIYCTKEKTLGDFILCKSNELSELFGFNTAKGINKGFAKKEDINLKGKVIGEFICDDITDIHYNEELGGYSVAMSHPLCDFFAEKTCLSFKELHKYLQKKDGYGWHISNFVIYSKPKELSDFYVPCKKYDLDKKEVYEAHCIDCGNKNGIAPCEYINQKWCIPVKRPPQSWMYVNTLQITK